MNGTVIGHVHDQLPQGHRMDGAASPGPGEAAAPLGLDPYWPNVNVSHCAIGELNAPAMSEPGYEQLATVLHAAYAQAAYGKGKERHANNKPFHEQPMQDLIRLHGVGFATGQASKKASEGLGFVKSRDRAARAAEIERALTEIYGAIVYLAGAAIALKREAGKAC